jgi:hypothetical protein
VPWPWVICIRLLRVAVALCKIYFPVEALPAAINARFSLPSITTHQSSAPSCSPTAQSDGNCRRPVVGRPTRTLLSMADAASGVTGAKGKSRRQANLQHEKRRCAEYDVRVTLGSWRLSYFYMYAVGGAITKSVRFLESQTPQNLYPPHAAVLPPPWWLRATCCRPTSPSASFDGKDR